MMAAYASAASGHQVILLEKNEKLGKKIYITGKGRCNVTNAVDREQFFRNIISNSKFLYSSIYQFDARAMMDFLEEYGCQVKTERGGRVFPVSDHASDVTGALQRALSKMYVEVRLHTEVKRLLLKESEESGGRQIAGVLLADGKKLEADAVILACGGLSYASTGSDGSGYKLAEKLHHTVVFPEPALTALVCDDNLLKKAAGVRIHASVTAKEQKHTGDLQITEYGVSGIPVFNISRLVTTGDTIQIDFMPEFPEEQLSSMISHLIMNGKEKNVDMVLNGLFPDKIAVFFSTKLNIHNQACDMIDEHKISELAGLIKNYTVFIKKRRGFEFAQVTAGGVTTDEIHPETMESKKIKNLFFAGEIIDVDGICGGYNLHFAWASGMIAGGNCK